MYGQPSTHAPLAWSWVSQQLESAGTYWVVPRGDGHPHPRPVWGVWQADELFLSIGSPVIGRQIAADPTLTVHLESGVDVVIVEGIVSSRSEDPAAIAAYDAKYDWSYDVAEYGPLTVVTPTEVLAWRAAGRAGRDSFQQTGRWRME